MKLKRWLAGALAGLCLAGAALGLGGCAQGEPRVALFLYDANDTFISELTGKLLAQVPEGWVTVVHDAANSQAAQNRQIIEELEAGADLCIVNAVDRLASASIVEKCAEAGVGIIFFNREPLEDALANQPDMYYVGAAADSLGEKQADMVAGLFGENYAQSSFDKNRDGVVQLAILKGEQGHQDAEKRTENCVSRLAALGFSTEVLAIEVANWSREESYAAMQRLYGQYGEEIELIFSNNDDMALGAIDWMREQGVMWENRTGYYAPPIVVVGVDGTAVGLEAIDNGLLYGTVLNDSDNQAAAVILLATQMLGGAAAQEAPFPYAITNEHYVYIDGAIITRENLKQYR